MNAPEPGARTNPAVAQCASSPLFGRFKLQRLLGKSAQTLVWLAFDPQHDEDRVLVMPRAQVTDRTQRERRLQAMRMATRVTHPALAVALETGEHDRWPYVAYARGQASTLDELQPSQGFPPLDAARWRM